MKNLVIGVIVVCALLCSLPSFIHAENTTVDYTNADDVISTYTYQYKNKAGTYQDIKQDMHINQEDFTMIKGKYAFTLTDDVISTNRRIKSGDYIYFLFPDFAKTPTGNGTIYVENTSTVLATWEIVEELTSPKIKLTFSDYINDQTVYEIKGHFEFEFALNLNLDPNGGEKAFTLPLGKDTNATFYIKPFIPESTTPTAISKTASYDASSHQITWTIKPTIDKQDWTGYHLVDTLPSELSLQQVYATDASNVAHELAKDIDYTYDPNTKKINIDSLTNDEKQIKIVTLLDSSIYVDNNLKDISNTAQLLKPIDAPADASDLTATATQTIKKDWIQKSGSPINGNMIKWTLNVNKEKLVMKNGVITDTLQSDLMIDENTVLNINNKNIRISDPASIPTDDATIYATLTNNVVDGTKTLKIFLPRETKDSTNYTISFVTPVTFNSSSASYSNSATFDCGYWTGQGDDFATLPSISFDSGAIALPEVDITKSSSLTNKKQGIITWTILASSNRAEYGKTTITDTINKEDTNLTYTGNMSIKDLVTNEKKDITFTVPQDNQPTITTTTIKNPDGNDETLFITVVGSDFTNNQTIELTFSGNDSLKNAKQITLETKIKDAVYLGKELSENKLTFRNHAEISIFDITNNNTSVGTDNADNAIDVTNNLNAKSNIDKASYPKKATLTNPDNNPRAYFKLTVNPNECLLKDTIIEDNLNSMVTLFKKSGSSTYEEKLGSKWTYVPDSMVIVQKNSDAFTSNDINTIIENTEKQYTTSENILQFDFTKKDMSTTYDIYFVAELNRIDNGQLFEKNNFQENGIVATKGNVSNLHHSLLQNSEVIYSKETAQKDISEHVLLGKSGSYNKTTMQIDYKININQRKQNLGNPMIIEDYLSEAITLDPTTVKLYSNVLDDNGNFRSNPQDASIVDKSNYSIAYASFVGDTAHPDATSIATFTLPTPSNALQDEAYILTYSVDINDGHYNEKIKNDASLKGIHTGSGNLDSSSNVTVDDSSGGSATQRCNATLNKVDEIGQPQSGATFDLLLQDNHAELYLKSLTTKADGSLTFTGLKPNQSYVIKESKAPLGYAINTERWELTPTLVGHTYTRDEAFVNKKLETTSIPIQITKTLEGKDWLNNRSFQFNISKVVSDDLLENMQTLTYQPLQQMTLTSTQKTASFPKESFSYESGIHYVYYKIEEVGLTPGYENSSGTYYVRLKNTGDDIANTFTTTLDAVQCIENGQINTIPMNSVFDGHELSLHFINNYQALPVSYQIKGRSFFNTVNDPSLNGTSFVYELYTQGENTPMHIIETDEDGNFEFPNLSYDATQVGEHHYVLKVKKDKNQIEYDETMFDVLVKVSDNDQGTLSIEVTITQNGKAIEEIQFHHREQETPPNEEETIMPPSNDIENVENKITPTTKPNDTTSTGDTTSYISYMFTLLLSFVVIVCLRHMKQHN